MRLKRGAVLVMGRETIGDGADERWTGNRAFPSQLKYKEGVGWARSMGPSEWLRIRESPANVRCSHAVSEHIASKSGRS